MSDAFLIMSNFPDLPSAQNMARHLVEARLAACVNLCHPVQSVYRWQEKIEYAEEVALHIKTTAGNRVQVEQAILAAHPYEVPEIIAIKIHEGYAPYLQWIAQETSSK